jgi:hypothetical protein
METNHMARANRPLTEVDENNLRVLMSRLREEDPQRFIDIIFQTVLTRIADPNALVALRQKDNGPEAPTTAVIVIFKGEGPSRWAEESLAEMKLKILERNGPGVSPEETPP